MFKSALITIFLIILLLVGNGIAGYFFYFIVKMPDFFKHLLQIFSFVLTGIIFKKYLNNKKQLFDDFYKSNYTSVKLKDKDNINYKFQNQSLNKEQKICPYCAEIIKFNAKKCRYCSEWLYQKN